MAPRPGYGIRLDSARRLIDEHTPVGEVDTTWPAGRVRLRAHIGAVVLPPELPHRVRCLVTRGDEVLVTWDVSGSTDCLPGGGAEPGETIVQTACREVLEETGWHLDPDSVRVLGWMHIESGADFDERHPFPHPDGFMTVVHAHPDRPEDGHVDWEDVEGFVTRSAFVPIAEVPEGIRTSPIHTPYLDLVLGEWRQRP